MGRLCSAKLQLLEGLEFRDMRNIGEGQRCFILGTGPSLLWENRELLQHVLDNEWSVGCNGLFKWEGIATPPVYYAMTDHPAFPMWREDIEKLDTYRVAGLRADWPGDTPLWHRVLQRRDMPVTEGNFGGLEAEFTWCAGRSNVVWSLCVQLAFWLGFKEVYLLGIDGVPPAGEPPVPRLHCYEIKDFLLGRIAETTSNWNPRTVQSVQKAVPFVQSVYEEHGRKLVNLNPDSFVRGLSKSTLREVLNGVPVE
jgi:hypothetical protein